MANKYQTKVTSSLSNIEQSVKTFGPKMPSGDQDKQNENDEILDFTDVICGALLTFIFNKKYTKGAGVSQLARVAIGGANTSGTINDNLTQIKKSLTSNNQNSIPNLLKQINQSITKLKTNANIETASLNNNNKVFDINISGLTNDKSTKAFIDLIEKIEKSKTGKFNESIKSFAEAFSSDGVMMDMINTINNVDITNKTMSNANKMIDILKAFGSISDNKLALTGAKSIDIYVKMAEGFVTLSEKLGDIDVKGIERAANAMKDIGLITVVLTGTLILVGFVGGHLDYIGIGKFILALAFLTGSLLLIFNKKLTKGLAEANEGLKGLSLLVTVCGALLIGASLISDFIKFESLATFISNLTGFISGLLLVFKILPTSGVKQSLEGAEDVALLVGVCGSILIFASLTSKLMDPRAIVLFSGALILLITSLAIPLLAWRNIAPGVLEGARDLALLVAVCGAVLIAGSLFMYVIDVKNLMKFATVLLGFMFLLSVEVLVMNIFVKKALTGLEEFALLVAISAGILIFGGTFLTLFPSVAPGMIKFALLLALGMALIILPLNLMFGEVKMAIKSALGLAILIGTIALVMTLGAYLMNDNRKVRNALLFAGIVAGFLFVMGGIIFLLNKFTDDIGSTVLALMGITAITGIFGIIFYAVIKMNIERHQKHIWLFLGAVSAFTIAMIGLSILTSLATPFIAVGLIGMIGIDLIIFSLIQIMKYISDENKHIALDEIFGDGIDELFKSGLSFKSLKAIGKGLGKGFIGKSLLFILGMGAISGLLFTLTIPLIASIIPIMVMTIDVILISGTMIIAAKALKEVDKAGDADLGKMLSFVDKFSTLATSMIYKFVNPFITLSLPTTIINILGISSALGIMAYTIQQIASLNIPIYDENSLEIKGYRNLTDQDFLKASTNIESIISTIGGAVQNVYLKYPKMFDSDWFSDSPFTKVAKSLEKLGPMIEKIASSIRDYAELKIPVYEGTKKVGYEHLTESHFSEASKNISLIITTLGQTIIDTYNNNKAMFDDGGNWFTSMFLDSPFTKVVKQTSKLGSLISNIADAVKDYAEMKVPYVDPNTGLIDKDKFRVLDIQDFKDASKNVSLIITTLGQSIIDTYNNNPEMFKEGDNWFTSIFSDSPFAKVLKQTSKLGSLISNIADAVKDYAEMKVPYVDPNTGLIDKDKFRLLTDADYKSARKNITDIVVLMTEALINLYKDPKYKQYFDIDWYTFGLGESDLEKVINQTSKLGGLISDIAGGVKDFAELKIPIYDNKGQISGYRPMDKTDFNLAQTHIKDIIITLSGTLAALADEPYFDDDSKMLNIVTITSEMGNMISSIARGIKEYAELKIPKYDNNGNPIDYISISSDDFTKAGTNIGLVVGTLAEAMIKISQGRVVQNNKWSTNTIEEFKDIWEDKSDIIENVINVSSKMGDMIYNLAKGLNEYSSLKFVKYNKDGSINQNESTQLTDNQLLDASANIGKIIGTLAESLIRIGEGQFYDTTSNTWKVMPKLAKIWENGVDATFKNMIDAIEDMGNMVSSISKSLQSYATLKIPTKWVNGKAVDYVPMTEKHFKDAAKNISTVISTMALTLYGVYSGNFTDLNKLLNVNIQNSSNINSTFWEDVKNNKSPINIVLDASKRMGEIITSISKAVQGYASLNVPTQWDKDGKPIQFESLNKQGDIFKKASENIAKVITAIGEGILGAYNLNSTWFDPVKLQTIQTTILGSKTITETEGSTPIYRAILAAAKMGDIISNIANGVLKFANGKIFEYNDKGEKTGKPIDLKDYNIGQAKDKITEILKAIAEAVYNTYTANKTFFDSKNINSIMTAMLTMSKAISGLASNIKDFAQMKIQMYDENGKAIKNEFVILSKDDITESANTIETVMNTLVTAFETYSDSILNKDDATKNITSIAGHTTTFVNSITTIVDEVVKLNDIINKLDPLNPQLIQERIDKLNLLLFGERIKVGKFNKKEFVTYRGGVLSIVKQLSDFNAKSNINDPGKELTNLSQGLGDLIDKINKIKTANNIKEWAKQTGEFVKHVKNIDPDKLGKLRDIATSMAELAKAETTNYFIEATEKFSESIHELTEALNKEEDINKKRKKLIEDNVKEIRTLMNQEMKVVLRAEQTSNIGMNDTSSNSNITDQAKESAKDGGKSTVGQEIINKANGGTSTLTDAPKQNNNLSETSLMDAINTREEENNQMIKKIFDWTRRADNSDN